MGVGAPRPWPKKWQRALREGRSVPRSHVVTAGPGRATLRRLPWLGRGLLGERRSPWNYLRGCYWQRGSCFADASLLVPYMTLAAGSGTSKSAAPEPYGAQQITRPSSSSPSGTSADLVML